MEQDTIWPTMIFVKQKDHVHMHVEASDEGITKEISDFFTFEVTGASFMTSNRNRHRECKIRLYNLTRRELYVGLMPYI